VDAAPKPWSEGLVYKGPTTDPLGRVVKHELRTGAARTLGDLAGEYHFFTPAVVYLNDLVGDWPLIDLMYELRRDVPFYYKKFRWPLFRGLETPDGDVDWNHALWAVRVGDWRPFFDFYCSVAARDRDRVRRIAAQTLAVLDPLAAEHVITGDVPAVTVTAFGIDGSDCVIAFEPGARPLLLPPELRVYPPRQRTRTFARALVRGENPHVAEELFLLRHPDQEARHGR
jgi:hypothetical protein